MCFYIYDCCIRICVCICIWYHLGSASTLLLLLLRLASKKEGEDMCFYIYDCCIRICVCICIWNHLGSASTLLLLLLRLASKRRERTPPLFHPPKTGHCDYRDTEWVMTELKSKGSTCQSVSHLAKGKIFAECQEHFCHTFSVCAWNVPSDKRAWDSWEDYTAFAMEEALDGSCSRLSK